MAQVESFSLGFLYWSQVHLSLLIEQLQQRTAVFHRLGCANQGRGRKRPNVSLDGKELESRLF